MKKMPLILSILLLLVATTSCKIDNDDEAKITLTVNNISGVYQINKYTTIDSQTVTNKNEVTNTILTTEGSQFNNIWIFDNDGTFTTSGEMMHTTINLFKGKTTEHIEFINFTNNGTYTVNRETQEVTLTFMKDNISQTLVYDVISFTTNELIIKAEKKATHSIYDNIFTMEIGLKK